MGRWQGLGLWQGCAWGIVLGAALCRPAAAGILDIDEKVGSTEGWSIGYSTSAPGCLASAKFSDGTTVWLGAVTKEDTFFLALTNPDWASIENGKSYSLRFSFVGAGRWQGKFDGLTRGGEKGVIASGLKEGFVVSLIRSPGVAVSLGQNTFAKLSLQGSPAAFAAIMKCQSERTSTARGGAGAPERVISSGTGFFITAEGHLLTNHHVVNGCSRVRVQQVGGAAQSARVLATDAQNDLGLLVTDMKPPAVAPLRSDVKLGENISVYGFPLSNVLASTGNFTVGYVSALAGLRDNSSQLQISAPVHPGNSGGPVLDRSGNVVGVVVSVLTSVRVSETTNMVPQNVNFAIKSQTALGFIDANNVKLKSVQKTTSLDSAEVAEQARLFTMKVLCEGS